MYITHTMNRLHIIITRPVARRRSISPDKVRVSISPRPAGSNGFGLLEVLISAAIIALISGATVALATNAVRTGILSGNRTVAHQLSQEGVELVRQMRDTTYVDGTANRWNSTIATCTTGCALTKSGSGWKLTALTANEAGEKIPLATGTPDKDGNLPTKDFVRKITIKSIPWYDETTTTVPNKPNGSPETTLALQVKSTVTWQEQGRSIFVDSTTFLTDWRPVQ